MDSSKKYSNASPELTTNCVSKLFFCWILPFFKFGYLNNLQVKDIYNATDYNLSGPLGDQLQRNWEIEIKRVSKTKQKPSLKKAIFKTFYKQYAVYGVYLFFQAMVIKSLQPIVLAAYIEYFNTSSPDMRDTKKGWILGVGVVVLAFINILVYHHCCFGCQKVGMRVRIACCSLVYRKLLKLSQASLGQTAAGQMVNLLSNDVQRFDLAADYLHYAWIMPIQFCVAFYLMFRSVGVAACAGMLAVTLEAIPLQGYLSRTQGKLRYKIAQRTDHRVKLMSEIVSGIQVIKMYAWEKPFEKIAETARRLEIDYVTKTSYIKGFSSALIVFTERLTLYLTLVTYVLLGNRLTGGVVFSLAQLFNTVQMYMCIFFPYALSNYAEAKVTIKRLEQFLLLEENHVTAITNGNLKVQTKNAGNIEIISANAGWVPNSEDTLTNINIDIKSGKLCCIVGDVGAGKSSILQMLIRELPLKCGKMQVCGEVSYACQEPWLFVSSVRSNILFGKPYERIRYRKVVKVCALERDFKQFPYGDKTLVGERGVSLSGGQRARINLARAVYGEADIYLFDDPLSAVDTHVGKQLFQQCIKNYLKDKTRILVTHQRQFLKEADLIIFIKNGSIEKMGTFEQISDELDTITITEEQGDTKETEIEQVKAIQSRDRLESIASIASSIDKENEPEETQELIEKGAIASSTYAEYYRTGANTCILAVLVCLFIIAQISCNSCDLWVTRWTNMEEQKWAATHHNNTIPQHESATLSTLVISTTINPFIETTPSNVYLDTNDLPQKMYIIIYSIFITASVVLTTARSILFYKVCMNASKGLHNKMFGNVLQAPMRFFDTNPSGRILNRFSKDMGTLDEILPPATIGAIQVFLVMAGIISMVFIVTPWMIAPAAVLGTLFYFLRVAYLRSAQDVKRLEGVTRAPVFSHVSASLYGISTIRASRAEHMLTEEFDSLQDQHTGTWYLLIASSTTFGFYLDLISTTFLALVTFQFLVFKQEGDLSGNVGLVISSSLILTGMLQTGVRQTTEVASNMTSVERILQYTKIKKEGANELITKCPDRNWPHAGKITFKNTYLRYVLEEPPVLKNLNIIINPGEKIGIVGRTGAGKSTLIASLFRLAPIEGTIAIDDVDTALLDLNHLRSNISIIPQEPILFSATVRYNLDPFEKVSDEVLWDALENVKLKGVIDSLTQNVNEGGSNFSAGQRQLMCLARAIVRNNKVLVMDEATANVDPHTDSLIQQTIRENFKDCTVLTIAHRLNTIMDSDKVLVMDIGQAVEFDHPHELLQNPFGYFTSMVQETGELMEKELRKLSREAWERKQNKIE